MTTQYIRNVSLIVAPANGEQALELNEFRIVFWVKRGDTGTPNSLIVQIYNLSDATVAQLQNAPTTEFSRVVLQVGYVGLIPEQPYLGTIFDGNIKRVNVGNESAKDSFIEIIAADGDSAYNFAFVNVTLSAGSTPNDVINACLSPMGSVFPPVTAGYIPDYSDQKAPRGKVLCGMSRQFIEETANSVNASWSIQDGQLQLVPLNGYLPGDAIELTSATGLIGYPVITQQGISVRCLINSKIKIGSRIHINNAKLQGYRPSLGLGANVGLFTEAIKTNADGFYRVLWIEHTGDTRGNQWYSDMICVSIDSSYSVPSRTTAAPDSQVNLPAR